MSIEKYFSSRPVSFGAAHSIIFSDTSVCAFSANIPRSAFISARNVSARARGVMAGVLRVAEWTRLILNRRHPSVRHVWWGR